jgi:hypothetical protein
MTNGIGGPHRKKTGKAQASKKASAKDVKSSLKRKGLLPAVLAKTRHV